jgi:hypothetical protein
MRTRPILALLLATGCTLASAQGPVYESKDKAGPVFSDQPSSGAKAIDLPPPNVVDVPQAAPQAPAPQATAPAYAVLAISAPENEGTIHSNTGAFNVRVRIAPALRKTAGDRITVKLDGNLLPKTYPSGRFRLTEADWQEASSPDNAGHTLQVAIVDSTGAVLIESAPITFYAHRATVRHR